MNKYRLEALADGVFAIVMTLLVIELKVPELEETLTSNRDLWDKLVELAPVFVGYIVGFAVLAVYWLSHHFLFSIFAKNVDRVLVNLNILFLAFISLVPFTSHLIGRYPETQLSVAIFGVNVVVIGSILYKIRGYVYHSDRIENGKIAKKDVRNSSLRILIPTVLAGVAIPLSFYNTTASIFLFIIPVLFNLVPGSFGFIDKLLIKMGLEKPLESVKDDEIYLD